MKGSSLNTHLGSIKIDNEVIAQYAGSVAVECFGIVGMAGVSMKDGLVHLLKKDSLTRGINVTINNNKLTLDFLAMNKKIWYTVFVVQKDNVRAEAPYRL